MTVGPLLLPLRLDGTPSCARSPNFVTLPLLGFAHALELLDNVRVQFAERGLIGPAGFPEGGAISPAKPAKSLNVS
jgi:hypothetical protein